MQIGFIGLGNLGMAIAENIFAKRQQLLVYNRTALKAEPLVEKGASFCNSIKELASKCDVVFSMVSDDAALNHVTKGGGGIAQKFKTRRHPCLHEYNFTGHFNAACGYSQPTQGSLHCCAGHGSSRSCEGGQIEFSCVWRKRHG